MPTPRHFSRAELLAWTAALAVAWAALALTGYQSRDPDSRLHAAIEADQLARPASAWIAPEWAGHWNQAGLYREHPVGTFIPPILLAKAGFPAEQAGYAVNALYQVLCLLLLVRLASVFVAFEEAHALAWIAQLIPIAFTYRVRANHEQALLFFFLLALYGTERSRRAPAWILATVAGTVGVMLVKGVFVLLIPPSCALWLVATSFRGRRAAPVAGAPAHPAEAGWRADAWAWGGIGAAAVAGGLAAAIYEHAYRQASGQPFAAAYLARQLGVAAVQAQTGAWMAARKLYNFGFYAFRVLWFAFPWSVLLLAGHWAGRRGAAEARLQPAGDHARGALVAAVAVAALWLAAFSASDRLADRFVFPIYYLLTAAGAMFSVRHVAAARRAIFAVERLGPFAAPALFLALFFLQITSPRLGLPYVNR